MGHHSCGSGRGILGVCSPSPHPLQLFLLNSGGSVLHFSRFFRNCLFRALGDQLEGHSRSHLELRQETVDYMMSHRQDFEPFVEDDIPFLEHLSNLAQPGTFAGNDAIVAFARSQQVKVVIHQLNTPLWEINGTEKQMCRELHIAYRYGDHYDSVRRIDENTESCGQIHIQVSSKQKKEDKRHKKKQRQEERNRLKVLNRRDQNQKLPEAVTLIPALNTLSI
ncbi:OTU domain-containing protein 3 isoform X2 [Syngnathus scovelli]|uniref:OTU domain-containing protein 3 isoform X2 n=1 Tax=Syngnathus scovelli TaxID=161590 RepID=UPI00210F4890|nr:OTU domain-containing protein 3 isoform X2 [Syngnathus scovelli]